MGSVVQVVRFSTGAVSTGTTLTPRDDTIPQNTEGDQLMSLAITPLNAANKLLIEVVVNWSPSIDNSATFALFQDSTANALAATIDSLAATYTGRAVFSHYMTAGTTSATTFAVRGGQTAAGTLTFNGRSGGRLFGGVLISSITITEIKG